MIRPSRRTFLGAAAVTAAGVAVPALPARAARPSRVRRQGALADVEHVVILMQENRSVDHYYGTMRGVRGFGDPAALTYADGTNVYRQPDSARPDGGVLLPWHVDTSVVDGQDLTTNDHSWTGVHEQWNGGLNDGFATAGNAALGFLGQSDVPFNRALARAFTFCDHYFASVKGSTSPNRLMHWTGTIDPGAVAGGPAIVNPPAYQPALTWTTYPERLQAAGISWQVFANDEVGDGTGEDSYVGDYSDNPLWFFQAYHDALASSDPAVRQLADRGAVLDAWAPNSGLGHDVTHVLADFLSACEQGTLPAVSWIVAPRAYSEHPAARPVDGAAYVQTVLNGIWAQPDLWAKTVVLLNYDEHDGFFDHVVPPTAPPGTPGEYVQGLPIGLGPRVPMTVVSPWSRGGWINSQVFDHTSVLRFLEQWTGVAEPNISDWRRAICGDLTSCFDFNNPDTSIPTLPDTAALRSQADQTQSKLPMPVPPPPGEQHLPGRVAGTVQARALPYQPWANATHHGGTLTATLGNGGSATVQLQVYDRMRRRPARHIDVAPSSTASTTISATDGYQVGIHAPNGFLRLFTGNAHTDVLEAALTINASAAHPRLRLALTNTAGRALVADVNGTSYPVRPSGRVIDLDPFSTAGGATANGWYDLTVTFENHPLFLRRFAGRLENGRPGITG